MRLDRGQRHSAEALQRDADQVAALRQAPRGGQGSGGGPAVAAKNAQFVRRPNACVEDETGRIPECAAKEAHFTVMTKRRCGWQGR